MPEDQLEKLLFPKLVGRLKCGACGMRGKVSRRATVIATFDEPENPNEIAFREQAYRDEIRELSRDIESELVALQDSFARDNEEGWFYEDDDDSADGADPAGEDPSDDAYDDADDEFFEEDDDEEELDEDDN